MKGIDNLGQFIKGLSRYELSTKLQDILNKTENINFDVLNKSHVSSFICLVYHILVVNTQPEAYLEPTILDKRLEINSQI